VSPGRKQREKGELSQKNKHGGGEENKHERQQAEEPTTLRDFPNDDLFYGKTGGER